MLSLFFNSEKVTCYPLAASETFMYDETVKGNEVLSSSSEQIHILSSDNDNDVLRHSYIHR
jgi:hypothetical protein